MVYLKGLFQCWNVLVVQGHHPHITFSSSHVTNNGIGWALPDGDIIAVPGELLHKSLECPDGKGKPLGRNREPCRRISPVAITPFQGAALLHNFAGIAQEVLPVGGGLDTAVTPQEELSSKLGLQLLDCGGQGGLREVKGLGGRRKRTLSPLVPAAFPGT